MIIYKATNIINKKIYIGKTINYLNDRIWGHNSDARLRKVKNSLFHAAIRKYGENSFEWEILCRTNSESKLNALEKFYIATYRKMAELYNILEGGDGSGSGENHHFYGKHHTEETKKKISKSKKGNCKPNRGSFKKGQKSWNEGIPCTEKTKKKLREVHTGLQAGEKNPFYGRKHSEGTKKKISKTKKGNSPAPNKGKHLSEETKQKLRDYNLGKYHTEETKKKISEGLKNRKNIPEIYKKIVETKKTNGYIHSDETKRKISESNKGKIISEESKEKNRQAHIGKKASFETRKKMSESRKRYYQEKRLKEKDNGL